MAAPGSSSRVVAAARAALAAYGLDQSDGADEGTVLLGAMLESLAGDMEGAPAPRDRVAAARALLEVADRLDLVPSAPAAGRPVPPPAAVPAPTQGGDRDSDNPFDVPDVPPGVGYAP